MKKFYESPELEQVRFSTEDITIVLPDDDLDGGMSQVSAYTTCDRL